MINWQIEFNLCCTTVFEVKSSLVLTVLYVILFKLNDKSESRCVTAAHDWLLIKYLSCGALQVDEYSRVGTFQDVEIE